ncbi:MAG: WD40 repeat domain-containing protein [Deltaproteobacteria bacterium]|nr:WD40 repeat domain-containing protein [Deltaproteobacteria bacterium]
MMAENDELAVLRQLLTDPVHGYFFDRWRAVKRLTRLASTNGASPPLSEADARAVIDGLVAGLESVHWGVHRRCKRALETLQSQPLIDAVCDVLIERDFLQLRDLAVTARYEPADPLRKAAYLFVLGRQQFYEVHDPTGELLVHCYAATSLAARDHLLGLAHTRGDPRWARLIVALLAHPPRKRSASENTAIRYALGTPGFYTVHDPTGEQLMQYYTVAAAPERAQMLQAVRTWEPQRGAQFVLRLLQPHGWAGLSDEEREVGVQALRATEHADKLWALVQQGSLPWSWRSARRLIEAGGQPTEARAVACWAEIEAAVACVADPMRVGRTFWSHCAGLGHTNTVTSVAFSPDGTTLASGSDDHSIRLWDVARGQPRAVLQGHIGRVMSVAFSPDGTTLASGSDDHSIRLWDVARGQPRAVLQGHTDWVQSVAFSPDGTTLASGSDDHTVWLWDVARGQPRAVLQGHIGRVTSVAFSPDGTTLASGSWDHTILLWGVARGQERAVLQGHTNTVTSVAFSPDGTTLASGSGSTIRLWDVAWGQERAVLQGHTGTVWSVAFSPDGTTLASGSTDHTVRLWEALDLRRWTSVPLTQLTSEDLALAQRVLAVPSASAKQQAVVRYVAAVLRYRLGDR